MIINYSNPLTNNLVFDLGFAEGGGTVLRDNVKKNNMTTTGTPGWVTSPMGPGLKLDGSTQYASVPVAVSTKALNYSIEVWFKLNTVQAAGEKVVIYIGSDVVGNGVAIELDAGKLEVLFRGQNLFDTGKVLTAGPINHVILSNQSGPLNSVYLNGVITGATSSSSTTAATVQTSIGQDNSNNKRADITMYLARAWTRTLSKAEVVSLYTNPYQIYSQPVVRPLVNQPAAAVAATYSTFKTLIGVGNI